MTEIKSRGVNDILIAIVEGLKGFPEAINAVFAETQIQNCIVHLIRNSVDYCSWKDRKPVAQELKTISAPRTPKPPPPRRGRDLRTVLGARNLRCGAATGFT
jgi:transposase-like protein